MRRPPLPRLLPLTSIALAGVLAMKSVALVRAAAGDTAAAPVAQPPPPAVAVVRQAVALAPAPSPTAAPPPPAAPLLPAATDGERAVLQDLRKRRNELDARAANIAARQAVLDAAERKLDARVAELQALQHKLEALEAARQQREDASWRGLVKVYEVMRPRDAAVIFNDLDMSVLLQVVDRMKEAKAAPILASMQPDKARELTAKLAAMRMRQDTPAPGG